MRERVSEQISVWEREYANKWINERGWSRKRTSWWVYVTACGAEYWSDWGGGSFVMNKSFCTPHTAVGRAYTDPSQHTEDMWLSPLTEPALAHSHVQTLLRNESTHAQSLPFSPRLKNLHRSGLQDDTSIIRSPITYSSSQWTPAAPMRRKHTQCFYSGFLPFHFHHFIMRQTAIPVFHH